MWHSFEPRGVTWAQARIAAVICQSADRLHSRPPKTACAIMSAHVGERCAMQ